MMKPIKIELSKEEAMDLEVILDAHKRQVSFKHHSCVTVSRVQKQIREGLKNGD